MLRYTDVATKAEEYVNLCLASSYAKDQQIVHLITLPNFVEGLSEGTAHLLAEPHTTLKVEHFESFDADVWAWCQSKAILNEHDGPFTAHVFISPVDGYTFREHTDPDDVLVFVLSGSKTMVMREETHVLQPGMSLFIPANTPHYAVNNEASVMVSLGFEKWMVSKL